jgi:type I restriction enzyme M protein
MSDVVQKLWGFCHTLRHDGIDYGDYIEQITFLLFLKMAAEKRVSIPRGCDWPTLREKSGTALLDRYSDILRRLGKTAGLLGDVYAEAQSKFSNAVNLKKLINLIDETEWTSLGVDVKAAAYEGLLEKAASEGKKGAGQYFTPRVLIESIVACMKPDPRAHSDLTICDPACGTGGFLVAAYEWLLHQTKGGAIDRTLAKRIKSKTYYGQDLVARPRRLALMNLYLHGIEPIITLGDTIYEAPSPQRFDIVLTNPPFGSRGANQAPEREDFTVATSNKQLNFLQHVLTILKSGGRAAVVVPDNCLFADQAGEVFKILTEDCNVHTVLRLPHGTFVPYSQGVRANVVFLTKGLPTKTVWIYDGRTNVVGVTKKGRPLSTEHFREFERCFGSDPNGASKRRTADSKQDRWREFDIREVRSEEFKLDNFRWIKEEQLDDPSAIRDPEDLAEALDVNVRAIASQLAKFSSITISNGNGTLRRAKQTDVGPLITKLRKASRDWIEPSFEWRSQYELPEGAQFVALGNLGEWGGGLTPSKSKGHYWTRGSLPWVSAKDMKSMVLRGSIDHITKRAAEDTRLRLLPPGTLLFVVRGMILAHTLPIAKAGVELTINQDLRYLIPHSEIVPDYLHFVLLDEARHILFAVKESTHGTRRLESDVLKTWPIPLVGTAEQTRTVTRVCELSALAESLERSFNDAAEVAATLQEAAIAKGLKDGIGLG